MDTKGKRNFQIVFKGYVQTHFIINGRRLIIILMLAMNNRYLLAHRQWPHKTQKKEEKNPLAPESLSHREISSHWISECCQKYFWGCIIISVMCV